MGHRFLLQVVSQMLKRVGTSDLINRWWDVCLLSCWDSFNSSQYATLNCLMGLLIYVHITNGHNIYFALIFVKLSLQSFLTIDFFMFSIFYFKLDVLLNTFWNIWFTNEIIVQARSVHVLFLNLMLEVDPRHSSMYNSTKAKNELAILFKKKNRLNTMLMCLPF